LVDMKKLLTLFIFAVTMAGLFGSQPASAQGVEAPPDTSACTHSFIGIPTWYKYLELDEKCRVVGPCVDKETGNVPSEGCDEADESTVRLDVTKVVTRVALAVIDILLRLGGMVAFAFIVYSGFRFALSSGNSDQEKAARETAINALIGLVITIFAIGIVTFLGETISAS
jgi:hypothetical protein